MKALLLSSDTPTDMSYFIRWYLDGDQNVDGMVWKTGFVRQFPMINGSHRHPNSLAAADQSVSISEPGNEIDSDGPGEPAPSNGKAND